MRGGFAPVADLVARVLPKSLAPVNAESAGERRPIGEERSSTRSLIDEELRTRFAVDRFDTIAELVVNGIELTPQESTCSSSPMCACGSATSLTYLCSALT